MRAAAVRKLGEAPVITDLPVPGGQDSVLIRVSYAGVNPVDWQLVDQLTPGSSFPFVVGVDVAGVVEHVPARELDLHVGDRVFGMARSHGSYAEYTAVPASARTEPLARIPGNVVEVAVRRHALTNSQPFSAVLDGILSSISRPDIGQLIRKRGASTSYEEFRSLVSRAQGGSSLMRFVQLDLDTAFTHDPQARGHAGRRLVRLIAGNPVTMGEMTRHVPDSGSYAPITILLEEMRDGETRVAYDTV